MTSPILIADSAISRMARRLARVAVVLALLVPLLVLAQMVFGPAISSDAMLVEEPLFAQVEWTPTRQVIAAGVALMPALALMLVLLLLARICYEYAAGRLFSAYVVRTYRHLGKAMVAVTLLHWLQPTILGLALATTLPAGKRFLHVGLSSDELMLVLLTALVFLLAAVMQVAKRIHDENAEIV